MTPAKGANIGDQEGPRRVRRPPMAEFTFIVVALLVLFALAMNRASLRLWAFGIALLTLGAQMGLVHGNLHRPVFMLWALFGWPVAGLLFALSFKELRRKYVVLAAY